MTTTATATATIIHNMPQISSNNKTDRHNITEVVLKVALSAIKQTNKHHGHIVV
jgi:hypothetical protein